MDRAFSSSKLREHVATVAVIGDHVLNGIQLPDRAIEAVRDVFLQLLGTWCVFMPACAILFCHTDPSLLSVFLLVFLRVQHTPRGYICQKEGRRSMSGQSTSICFIVMLFCLKNKKRPCVTAHE